MLHKTELSEAGFSTQYHAEGISLLFDKSMSRQEVERAIYDFLDSYFSADEPLIASAEDGQSPTSFRLFL